MFFLFLFHLHIGEAKIVPKKTFAKIIFLKIILHLANDKNLNFSQDLKVCWQKF